ncbi:FimB/Mfa2 family fimbrial subunit, partial [Pseudoneobacillus sp. C159]
MYEDLDPCPQGLRLRFVYDYNMEFANAFPTQVECLTVLFYDSDGKYVTTRTNNTSDLADENWRMTIDLEPDEYQIIAYGGMECEQSS